MEQSICQRQDLGEVDLERELEELENEVRSALAKIRELRQVVQRGVLTAMDEEPVKSEGERRLLQGKELLTVPEAAGLLSLSRTTVYELVAAGDLPVVKIGRATRIPAEALRAWVARQMSVRTPPT